MQARRILLTLSACASFIAVTCPVAYADDKPAQTITLEGLSQPTDILIDRWGVPHIYAQRQRCLLRAGLQRRARPAVPDRPVATARPRRAVGSIRSGVRRAGQGGAPLSLSRRHEDGMAALRSGCEAVPRRASLPASTPISTGSRRIPSACRMNSARSATRRRSGTPTTWCASAATASRATSRAKSRARKSPARARSTRMRFRFGLQPQWKAADARRASIRACPTMCSRSSRSPPRTCA